MDTGNDVLQKQHSPNCLFYSCKIEMTGGSVAFGIGLFIGIGDDCRRIEPPCTCPAAC